MLVSRACLSWGSVSWVQHGCKCNRDWAGIWGGRELGWLLGGRELGWLLGGDVQTGASCGTVQTNPTVTAAVVVSASAAAVVARALVTDIVVVTASTQWGEWAIVSEESDAPLRTRTIQWFGGVRCEASVSTIVDWALASPWKNTEYYKRYLVANNYNGLTTAKCLAKYTVPLSGYWVRTSTWAQCYIRYKVLSYNCPNNVFVY